MAGQVFGRRRIIQTHSYMKLLVLGGNGQLGREWSHVPEDNLAGELDIARYGSGEADITDRERIWEVLEREEPDAVVNCAAYTAVDRAESKREQAMKLNAVAPGWLGELCAEKNTMLVHYSTDYVFPGRKEDRDRRPEGYREEDEADPVNWYGMTKWRGEKAVRSSGCRHLILRLSWLCGRYGENFVKTMLRLGRGRDRLKVVDDQLGSPTYAFHVVACTLALLKAGREGTFHVTSEGLLSWHEFAGAVFELSGMEVELEPVPTGEFPTEAERPAFSKLSTAKLGKGPGVELLDWKEGLKKLLTQLKNDGDH